MSKSAPPGRDLIVKQLVQQAGAFRTAGRMAESVAPMQRAAALAPKSAAIQHDLGLTLLQLGRAGEAAAVLKRAIAADPKFAHAYWRLGIALESLGDGAAALTAYGRACELAPTLAHAFYRRGAILEELGRRTEAAQAYRQASGAATEPALRYLTEALALLVEDKDAEAETVLRAWRQLQPDNPDMNEMLGGKLSDRGQFEEARALFERSLATDPSRVGVYYDLVRCRRATEADRPLIARMQAAAGQTQAKGEPLTKLHLAIGKALDDLGEHEAAMRAFDRADAERAQFAPFDAAKFEASVDWLIDRFTPEVIQGAKTQGNADATPILIFGMPRSGTTLMEQIVSSHPQVAGAGELLFWARRGAMLERTPGPGVSDEFLSDAAKDAIALLRRHFPDAPRITDKAPINFRWAGLVHLTFPQARIIHCRRNPIDTAVSIHQTNFNPHLAFPTGGENLVRYYRAYQRLTAHWRAVLPADRFLEIDYEALTADPEPIIRQIIAFCGLPWDEACLRPEDNDRFVKTPSKWQTRQTINRGSVERWRRYDPWLGPLAALIDGRA